MSETVNIRLPGVVDLTQYRVQVGDTVAFIEKINGTQTDLEGWAQELTFCATDLQAAASQIGTRHAEIIQAGVQVAQDKAAVQQLRTEAGEQKQLAETAAQTATEQAVIATGAADTASQAASVASAAEQSVFEDAGIASQAATVSTQQRQLAEAAAQQAAQSAIEAGPTNLSVTRTAATVTVQSSTGDDAVLPAASVSEAGLMSAADKQALQGVVEIGPTDLSFSRTATTLTVRSSTGVDAELPAASVSEAGLMSAADKQALAGKQDALTSGVTIKTVNGESLMGSGNISIIPTTAEVVQAYSGVLPGNVGSYVVGFLSYSNSRDPGYVVSGSDIRTMDVTNIAGGTKDYLSLSGSWRLMQKVNSGNKYMALFLRIV